MKIATRRSHPTVKKIVFVSDRDKNWEIYVIDRRKKNKEERLTKNNFWDGAPVFSPDGKSILYATKREGSEEICLLNLSNGRTQYITNNPASDMHPRFSPDGKKIVYYSNRAGSEDIYMMTADGKNTVRLTHGKGSEMEPSFDPTGRKIVYDAKIGKTWEIFLIDLNRPIATESLIVRIVP